MSDTRSIGVFDSGLGGLTVVRAIRALLPDENVIYLGDTARVPYGTRSAHTIVRYARSCAAHLVRSDIKFLVVACNTVSAVALPMLRLELDIPVLGVIGPGARAGMEASESHIIGVLATAGTIASGAYPQAIAGLDSRAQVHQQSAPLWVPLVEEGWLDGQVPELVADRYLQPLIDQGVDTLILGCTHYPLLLPTLKLRADALAPRPIQIVDSALAAAEELSEILSQRGLAVPKGARKGTLSLLVTDHPAQFSDEAGRFLGESVAGLSVKQVDL